MFLLTIIFTIICNLLGDLCHIFTHRNGHSQSRKVAKAIHHIDRFFYLQKLHNIRTALNDHNQIKREAEERKKKYFNARRRQRWRLHHQCAAETLLNDMLKTTFHFDLNTNEL